MVAVAAGQAQQLRVQAVPVATLVVAAVAAVWVME